MTNRKQKNLSLVQGEVRPPEGPLLKQLLDVYRMNEEALRHPQISELAAGLSNRIRELGSPIVWPVGEAAERLAGASVLISGDLRLRGWIDDLRDEAVLAVSLAASSPVELVEAGKLARALGAKAVHACGWNVAGLDSQEWTGVFDTVSSLGLSSAEISVKLVAS